MPASDIVAGGILPQGRNRYRWANPKRRGGPNKAEQKPSFQGRDCLRGNIFFQSTGPLVIQGTPKNRPCSNMPRIQRIYCTCIGTSHPPADGANLLPVETLRLRLLAQHDGLRYPQGEKRHGKKRRMVLKKKRGVGMISSNLLMIYPRMGFPSFESKNSSI